jgi:NADPH:quinone reductase-like Zn-dependent oxidoreductase
MSRFVQQDVIADPFELTVVDRPEPQAGPGQVRVRVAAAGLNPVDWKIASNPAAATAFGVSAPTGFGNDFAGVVDEVGDGVTDFAVGDRVLGGARGRAVADHVVVDPSTERLVAAPVGLDLEVASALTIAGLTADAVLTVSGLKEGETVVVSAAAGGVGVLTVQLAKRLGATVIGTASEKNHDFLSELGAIPVAYGEGLADRLREATERVDVAIDLHGTDLVEAAAELGVVADRIVTIAAGPNQPHGARATGGTEASPGALDRIARGLADETLILPIEARFPIEQIDEAVALQRSGHVRGKVVILT